jgi:pimeloyl-ACP methyl ester carboxylesterase
VAEQGESFREGWVEADGFRIRFMQAGDGPPLVHLHGAGGLRLTPAHDLLRRSFRVVVFEMPGFGGSAENVRTQTMPEMAATMAKASGALGLDRFNLLGTSFGGKVALWLAAQQPGLVSALVLEAPAAILQEGTEPVSGSPEENARRLYAHPERMPPSPAVDPVRAAQALALVRRLRGPARDAALEDRLRDIATPTLVVFGTLDSVIPPSMGRIYKELMPNSHLVFVYDAGHAIAAERPEAFAEVVIDFLERSDAFLISRAKTVIFP